MNYRRSVGDFIVDNGGWFIVAILVALFGGLVMCAKFEIEQLPSAYAAWTNVMRVSITYDQWLAMKNTRTLPGVPVSETTVQPAPVIIHH